MYGSEMRTPGGLSTLSMVAAVMALAWGSDSVALHGYNALKPTCPSAPNASAADRSRILPKDPCYTPTHPTLRV